MKPIQMTIDDDLLKRVDQVTQAMGMARSDFIRRALEDALRSLKISELEEEQRKGYLAHPVTEEEFGDWVSEQAWGE